MTQAQRLLLAGKTSPAGRRQVLPQFGKGFGLATRLERLLEFVLTVEVILDDALVAAGDEDEMFDAGLPRLVDHILDQRFVDDGEHFLRHRLGGGQDAGAEAGDREDGFTDFHAVSGCR